MSTKARVLFVCTANAARSQLAEALLRHLDAEHYEAFSAGTAPTEVSPQTIAALAHLGISTEGLRSKSVDEFSEESFDYVITLCDKAAAECQTLPGAGEALSWSFTDPATSTQPDAFRHTLHEIHDRIKMFLLVKSKHREQQ
ncbi:MAG: arsenate reductase ArsC [Pseudomonas gingeri]